MNGRNWGVATLAGWVMIIIVSSFYGDPDEWLVVGDVHVADAVEGHPPSMRVRRSIKQSFRGSWLVDVNRREGPGFVAVCTGAGQNIYQPTDQLPINLDLNWWTYPVKCHLAPGCYELDTVWTIRPPNVPPMEVRASSNEFCIKPRN